MRVVRVLQVVNTCRTYRVVRVVRMCCQAVRVVRTGRGCSQLHTRLPRTWVCADICTALTWKVVAAAQIGSDNGRLSEVIAVFRLGAKMTLAFCCPRYPPAVVGKLLNFALWPEQS